MTTQHERDAETGLDYRGVRYYDCDIARFLSLDPLSSKYPSWSAYNYVLSNPINLIDPTGKEAEDWFLNTKSGKMVYLKGKSEITQADLDKIGSPYSLSDYTRLGDDNMFGKEGLPVTLPKSLGTNPLQKDYLIVDEVFTEVLMDYLDYVKVKKITVKEREFIGGGSFGGNERVTSTTHDMNVIGESRISFIKESQIGKITNLNSEMYDEGKYNTIEVVTYNTTIPYNQDKPKKSYFDKTNNGKTMGGVLGVIGSILDAYWDSKGL